MDDKHKAREYAEQNYKRYQIANEDMTPVIRAMVNAFDAGYAAASAQPATEPDKRKLMITNKPLKEFVPEVTIVYSDGTWKSVLASQAWEYENDPDYLVTIPPFTQKENNNERCFE